MYIGFKKCIKDSENVYRIQKMYIGFRNVHRIRKMYIGFGKCIKDSENVYRIRKMYRGFRKCI